MHANRLSNFLPVLNTIWHCITQILDWNLEYEWIFGMGSSDKTMKQRLKETMRELNRIQYRLLNKVGLAARNWPSELAKPRQHCRRAKFTDRKFSSNFAQLKLVTCRL